MYKIIILLSFRATTREYLCIFIIWALNPNSSVHATQESIGTGAMLD